MKKLFMLIALVAVMVAGCNHNSDNTSRAKVEEEVFNRLDSIVVATAGSRTQALNKEMKFSSDDDSIFVVEFTMQFNTVSGRSSSGQCEYVYYKRGYGSGEIGRRKDMLIDLGAEQSIIEQAKDFADECERDMEPSQRDSAATWQECMFVVVPLRFLQNDVERLKEY